ncbi:Uncharacterised protein [Bacteroides xylanisolvens]|nr:Uncharacterised protein [Bacteroides xylanisolvens]
MLWDINSDFGISELGINDAESGEFCHQFGIRGVIHVCIDGDTPAISIRLPVCHVVVRHKPSRLGIDFVLKDSIAAHHRLGIYQYTDSFFYGIA